MYRRRTSSAAFANWRLQSARKPVVVTHHGKDAHVLISLDDYRRLDGEMASQIAAPLTYCKSRWPASSIRFVTG